MSFIFRDDVCGSFSCYASSNLCSSPIKPEDHCCYDVCGAAVHVDTEGYRTIKLSMLRGGAEQILSPAYAPVSSRKVAIEKDSVSFDNVQYHISRMTSSRSFIRYAGLGWADFDILCCTCTSQQSGRSERSLQHPAP